MGKWIRNNLVLAWIINLALCILLSALILKGYVDYKVNDKVNDIQTQLNKIERSTDFILEIMKEGKVNE